MPSVMASNPGAQSAPASRRRLPCILLAVALVLHWAAASFKPFDPLPTAGKLAPAFSSADLGFQRGTLPRLLARSQALDAGPPKSNWSLGSAGSKLEAAPFHSVPGARDGKRPSVRYAVEPRRPAAPTHAFEARGPPTATVSCLAA
jgi:hypothetical protein